MIHKAVCCSLAWLQLLTVLLSLLPAAAAESATALPAAVAPNATQLSVARKTNVDVQETLELLDVGENQLSWQQLLINAPSTVFLLGQLVVLSRKRDFKFAEVAVPYKRLKYQYFAPALLQTANEGWFAFNTANKNMHAIALNMNSVGGNVFAALQILATGNADLITRFLKIPMDAIQRSVDKCGVFANDTATQFTAVVELLTELQEAVVNTQAVTEEKKHELELQRKLMEETRRRDEQITTLIGKELGDIRSQLAEARRAYQQALDDIPTGWELVLMDLVKMINPMTLLTAAFSLPAAAVGGTASAASSAAHSASGGVASGGKAKPSTTPSDMSVFGMAGSFSKSVDSVVGKIKGMSNSDRRQGLKTLGVGVKTLLGLVSKRMDSNWAGSLQSILADAKNVLDGATDGNGTSTAGFDNVAEKLGQLAADSQTLAATGEAAKPGLGEPIPEPSSGEGGGNERFKARMLAARLDAMEQKHTQIFLAFVDQNRRMNDVILKIATIDLETADFDQILEVISEAITVLSELKEQWGRLVIFFQRLSVIVNEGLKEEAINFNRYVRDVPATQAVMVLSSLRNVYQSSAIRLATYAKVVATIAKTYVNVSESYIMNRLAGLGKLMAARDSAAQHQLLVELQQESISAQASVTQQCTDNRKDLEGKLETQRLKIEAVFDAVGRPTAAEESLAAVAQANLLAGPPENATALVPSTSTPALGGSDFVCPFCD